MQDLIIASLKTIWWEFPDRSFFSRFSVTTILEAFIFLFVVGMVTPIALWVHPLPGVAVEGFKSTLGFQVLQYVLFLALSTPIFVYMLRWIINKYAKQPFTLKEAFAVDLVFTAGGSMVLSALDLIGIFSQNDLVTNLFVPILGILFVLYMLIVMVNGIAQVAKISRQKSALAVIIPTLACFVGMFMSIFISDTLQVVFSLA